MGEPFNITKPESYEPSPAFPRFPTSDDDPEVLPRITHSMQRTDVWPTSYDEHHTGQASSSTQDYLSNSYLQEPAQRSEQYQPQQASYRAETDNSPRPAATSSNSTIPRRKISSESDVSQRIWNQQEKPPKKLPGKPMEPGLNYFRPTTDQARIDRGLRTFIRSNGDNDQAEVLEKPTQVYAIRHITIFWTPAGTGSSNPGRKPTVKYTGAKQSFFEHWGLVIQDSNHIDENGFSIELDRDGKRIFAKGRSWYARLAEAVKDVGLDKASTIFRYYRTGVWTEQSNQEIFNAAERVCADLGGEYKLGSANCQDFANNLICAIQSDLEFLHGRVLWTPMKTLGTILSPAKKLTMDDMKEIRLPVVTLGKPMTINEHNHRVDDFLSRIPKEDEDKIDPVTRLPVWMTSTLESGTL